ncbi:hypothetical protein [Glycomyces tenuis]|uniref:hypothetical protein n=1 Tax=Glycomyces tenuis TaxID=58116 RepID=UPI00040CAAB3|nr:hypothetical protein [Glycomyces tenuis]
MSLLPAPVRRVVESVRSRITAPVREELTAERNNNELLSEAVADLERHLYEPEWIRLAALTEVEFSVDGMRQLRAICRLMTLKNPMIKRGAALRAAYVWGQGVEITARANGKNGQQDVQAVVTAFLDDPGNQRTITSAQAQSEHEHALYTDGEQYLACFTNPRTGFVQVRKLPADEITEIITNPEDTTEPWFYRRQWTQVGYDAQGTRTTQTRERLYPCIDYKPRFRPRVFAGVEVAWDAPVIHQAVNRPSGWQHGVPDSYASIDWARAYKVFLEDWATVVKALSRFAFRMTSKGSARAQARAALSAAPPRDPVTGKAQDAGATAVTPMDAILEAIPKSGATIDSDSGRPIASMAAAGVGLPVTMLLGDPGTTGARATAETLDQPTELEMGQRRQLHTALLRRLLAYVITAAVRAPSGPLKGTITRDPYSGADTVTLDGDTSTVVDIDWPDLDDTDVTDLVQAIVQANGTGTIPPEHVLRLLLTALGVRHVDELVEEMLDDAGEFQWPKKPPLGPGGDAAALMRSGRDPTGAGPGPMDEPNDPPDNDSGEDGTEEDPASDEEDDEDEETGGGP